MKRKHKVGRTGTTSANSHKATPRPSAQPRIMALRLPLWLLSAAPLATVATVLTIFGYVVPRISVEPPGIVDAKAPYKSVFRVQNQGYWPINDIFYTINIKDCALNDTEKGYLELIEQEGEWLSYGPTDQFRSKPILDPLQIDSPSLEFTSHTFEALCRDGREMVLQVDYRPDYYPFKRTTCFRFRLQRPDSQQAQWIPMSNRHDFNPHFNARGTTKAWVFLEANARLFVSKDMLLKSHQMVLIGVPPSRRLIP
jgi:hypothetical protein